MEAVTTFEQRVGCGHDTHRLRSGGPLRLGGITIPHDAEFVAHSDGDVLLHSVTDALLGAAAQGDIGALFPNSDPANRARDSGEMLRHAWQAVRDQGWRLVNLDCIVMIEQPKLSAHKAAIGCRIAELLEVAPERINVKAKTGESVGPIGRGEAAEAYCVVMLERPRPSAAPTA